jgi:hypothetical protein
MIAIKINTVATSGFLKTWKITNIKHGHMIAAALTGIFLSSFGEI